MLAAVGLPMLLYLSIVASGYDGGPYLRGDCPYYLATAQSLWSDHDLDLSNQLPPPLSLHSGDVALDVHSRLVPKHPIWMPLVSMPLVVLLGAPGALVFNLMSLGLLLALLFELARRSAEPWPAMIAVSLTGALSFLPHYAYNYSPDVFLTVLLTAALVLLPHDRGQSSGRHLAAGLLIGMLLTARPSFVVALPALPLLAGRPLRRTLPWAALGTAGPVLVWMALNTHLFGGPLVTSYDRIAELTFQGMTLHSHRADFTLPLIDGLKGQLLDPDKGLLPTSAISLISLLGLPLLLRRSWRMGVYVTATSLGLLLLFSKYRLWPASHHGNRFLMPLVALAALPLACLVDDVVRRLRRSGRSGGPGVPDMPGIEAGAAEPAQSQHG